LRHEASHRRRLLRSCGAPRLGCRPPAPWSREREPRLEEPPKPSRPLSVAVATKAPVSAFPLLRHQLAPRALRPWGVHLRSQSRNVVPGLGGRIHDPDTLPSYRKPRARGPRTSRVPEPAPLRMRSRRGLRAQSEPVRVSMVRRRFESSRTVFARSRRRPARNAPCGDSFELGRACPCALGSARGRRDRRCVRSTSALRNRFHSSTRALVASQRSELLARARPFGARPSLALVPEPCGSVPVYANVFFAYRLARPKTREPGTGRLGAARCRRDWGEPRFTARSSLRRPDHRSRGGVFFRLVRWIPLASDSPVASSELVGVGRFSGSPNCGSKVAKTGSAGAS